MSTNELLTALIDVRGFPDPAVKSISQLADVSVMCITDVNAPRLAAGTIWLMCSDGNTLICDYFTATTLIERALADELRQKITLMREQNENGYCYILYSGLVERTGNGKIAIDGKPSGFAWRAWLGVLMLCQEYGAIVLPIDMPSELAVTLHWLAKKPREGSRMRPMKEGVFYEPGQAMLLDIPQVGPARMDALLNFTRGNVGYALSALTDTSLDLSAFGIPKVCQIEARRVLHLEDGLYLGPMLIGERETVVDRDGVHYD